jgi:hypothetical protein
MKAGIPGHFNFKKGEYAWKPDLDYHLHPDITGSVKGKKEY